MFWRWEVTGDGGERGQWKWVWGCMHLGWECEY